MKNSQSPNAGLPANRLFNLPDASLAHPSHSPSAEPITWEPCASFSVVAGPVLPEQPRNVTPDGPVRAYAEEPQAEPSQPQPPNLESPPHQPPPVSDPSVIPPSVIPLSGRRWMLIAIVACALAAGLCIALVLTIPG